jgi:hypothetical protein
VPSGGTAYTSFAVENNKNRSYHLIVYVGNFLPLSFSIGLFQRGAGKPLRRSS